MEHIPLILKLYITKIQKNQICVFFNYPSSKHQPEIAVPIKKTFEEGAQAIGATIVPVGEVWKEINEEGNPNIDLYDADGLHPSLQGTFLAASMYYASIYNRNPSENPYAADLEDEVAAYLKQKAERFIPSLPGQWESEWCACF
jgi:hypothetical protein